MSNATENGDEPAYPSVEKNDWHGLTKRESMAMHERAPDDMCLQLAEKLVGMKLPPFNEDPINNARFWATAHAAYRVMQADALLAELARTEG